MDNIYSTPIPSSKLNKVIIILLLAIILALVGALYLLMSKQQTPVVTTIEPTKTAEIKPTEAPIVIQTPTIVATAVTPVITQTTGNVYKNVKYGFELSFSAPYKALTDKDNLYGYPNGVALIYSGGQAYDVVVEAWDSEIAYQSHYAARVSDLTVLKIGNKFITFFDNTQSAANKKIIESVKLSK